MKYLIVGLGNIGSDYVNTRHNIGFMVLDRLISNANVGFVTERYAGYSELTVRGRKLILIKPTTYMNLSGKAVKYWMDMEKIPLENILVVVDDLALDTGVLRLKKGGSAGGHNGLSNINEILNTDKYARLRIGIGGNYPKGRQVDYVLEKFSDNEAKILDPKLDVACDMIKSFVAVGADQTMNAFNNR